jgi:hypothetical protein
MKKNVIRINCPIILLLFSIEIIAQLSSENYPWVWAKRLDIKGTPYIDDSIINMQLVRQRCSLKNINEQNFRITDTTYRILPAPENTYGYEVLIENKVFIYQPNIPGKAGIKGFKKKTDAEKVARLVIKKLSQGIMPPTVEEKELIELKINF